MTESAAYPAVQPSSQLISARRLCFGANRSGLSGLSTAGQGGGLHQLGIEDQIREMEAAKQAATAAEASRARLENGDEQARATRANELLRKLSEEALRALQSRTKPLGLEMELYKQFGSSYGVRTGRKVWLLPKVRYPAASIPDVGFLDDGTPVWASRAGLFAGLNQYNANMPKINQKVDRALQKAGCVVAINPVKPIVARGYPVPGPEYDSRQTPTYGFFIGDDGRLTYGYGPSPGGYPGRQTDAETCFAQSIAGGTTDKDW
jgi:hypothetical protein